MRIDSHQHFWDLDRLPYPWMPPAPSPLHRNYLPKDLAPILAAARFDGCVTVQAAQVPEEAEWLLGLAAENSFILGVVAWVDLTGAGLATRLDRLQRNPKFKGVRHLVQDESDDRWLMRADVLRGLRELARRDIPYDLLLHPRHLPLIPGLAESVPGLRMVIDHIAKPVIARHEINDWARDMERAASAPGLHVKLSGMITEADHAKWTAVDLRPYVIHALSSFGPKRCMFGSDWPVCLQAGTWKAVLAALTQAAGPMPQASRDELLGDTAARFYGLTA